MISRLKCEACGASRAASSTRRTDKNHDMENKGGGWRYEGETRVEHLGGNREEDLMVNKPM